MKYTLKTGLGIPMNEALVKRAFYLAWTACGRPAGMGILQDRGQLDEDQVWQVMFNKLDYPGGNSGPGKPNGPGEVYGDYVAGRMIKLGFKWDDEVIQVVGMLPWEPDYQLFAKKYPTPSDLFNTAARSLNLATETLAVQIDR